MHSFACFTRNVFPLSLGALNLSLVIGCFSFFITSGAHSMFSQFSAQILPLSHVSANYILLIRNCTHSHTAGWEYTERTNSQPTVDLIFINLQMSCRKVVQRSVRCLPDDWRPPKTEKKRWCKNLNVNFLWLWPSTFRPEQKYAARMRYQPSTTTTRFVGWSPVVIFIEMLPVPPPTDRLRPDMYSSVLFILRCGLRCSLWICRWFRGRSFPGAAW